MQFYTCLFIQYHIIILIGLEIPTEQEFNNYIRDKVAKDWYDLGVQLGITFEKLNIIKINDSGNVQMCCTMMFQYWLQVDAKANWNKLIKALEDIKYNALAETIKKEILQGMQIFTHNH